MPTTTQTEPEVSFTPPPPSEEKPKKKTGKKVVIEEVKFEELKKPSVEPLHSEKVDIDQLKNEKKDESVSIDFMSGNYAEENVSKTTKKSEAPIDEPKSESGKTIKEVQAEIQEVEDTKNKELKPQDYEEIGSFAINIVDFLMSSLLKWWAKDSSDSAYTLAEPKKKVLTSQLSLILIKHQQKWSIEFLFLLTIVAIYSGPVMAAREHRKNPSDRKSGRPAKK